MKKTLLFIFILFLALILNNCTMPILVITRDNPRPEELIMTCYDYGTYRQCYRHYRYLKWHHRIDELSIGKKCGENIICFKRGNDK